MTSIFLDSSYILALEFVRDQHHHVAREHWQTLATTAPNIITTSYIFDEVVTFLNRRGFHARAKIVGHNLLSSSAVNLIHVGPELFYEGWQYFQHYDDKLYSLTDCISFVVMNQYGVTQVLSFDQHFAQAGFTPLPLNQ
ncbi:MAG: PIN domain-containing protein [Deinococcota bacterium]